MLAFVLRPQSQLLFMAMLAIALGGCASSAPTTPTPAQQSVAGRQLLVVDGAGLAHLSVNGRSRTSLQPTLRYGGLFKPASSQTDALVSFRVGGSTQLGLLSGNGAFTMVHETDGTAEYTAAWSDDGSVVFGYAGSDARGIGVHSSGGETMSAGCRASFKAYGFAPDDGLVVGDANNHYVVDADGCATRVSVDARKMHEVDFNPKEYTVAYILRELEYDRDARQYVPDSSLWIAGVDGSTPSLVIGDRYKPHRPRWSPDGTELAFDARLPDQPERRLISVYDVEQESSAFLNPSSVNLDIREWDAHWSPLGSRIAYMQQLEQGAPSLIVRPMDGSFSSLVGESGERFARWIDEDHLVVTNGVVERMVSIDGETSFTALEGAVILALE